MATLDGPPPGEFHERRAGRGIVLDVDHRILMIRGLDPGDRARGGFWWTPGGGLDDGESIEEGTRRELREEIGLTVADLGPHVLERIGEFPFGGRWIRQIERYFIVEAPAGFDPEPEHFESLERAAINEIRWLPRHELRALTEPSYPWCLADLVDHFVVHGRPSIPWFEEQRAGSH